MISSLSLLISFRFICSHYRNYVSVTSLSLISILSIAGIALGSAAVIIGLSIVNGFQYELNHRILAIVPHGEIELISQPWKNWRNVLKRIEKIPGVIAAEPYINFTALIENKMKFHTIQIRGVNPHQEERLSILPKFIQKSVWKNFKSGKQQIIMGKGIADSLKIKQGDRLSIIFSKSNTISTKLYSPKRIQLYLSGTLQIHGELDYHFAMIPIEDAYQYLDMHDSITGIAIKVNDVFNADKLVLNAGQIINNCVRTRSWIDTYGYLHRDIQIIYAIMHLSMMLIVGVACFNMVSTLIMSVKDKIRDIAILRTLGAKNGFIHTIFIWYGLLISLIGSLFGSIIGTFVSFQLTSILNCIEKLVGHQLLSSDIYFINFIPSKLHWSDVLHVLEMSSLISLLASWYPAHCASHIDPVNTLNSR